MIKNIYPVLIILALSACSTGIPLAPHAQPNATPYSFKVCHGFSCTARTPVTLNEQNWREIKDRFTPAAQNAQTERTQIANAISYMEILTQQKSGLNPDEGRAHTFEGDQDQMDCIDETVNTTRYLRFLDQMGLLRFNKPSEPIHRGYIIDGLWPHNTAAIEDQKTGAVYAVDSYYENNGGKTYIVEKSIWLDEWRPEGIDDEIKRSNQL